MSEVKAFSGEEVSKHSTREDIWIVIHGKVYDVTTFLDEHPGGEEVILEHAGIDATEAFEDIGHSEDARDMLKAYFVGNLDGAARTTASRSAAEGEDDEDRAQIRHKQNSSSWGVMIPLAFAAVLVAYKWYA
ncbi:hypothetical protein GGI07_000278 [Coemansia sp. Benny D115]|nr:hypothetical protein GGI07_000278 [Coemansia sp. Benny D115]